MSTSTLYRIIPVDSTASFKQQLNYYQGLLHHAHDGLDIQCAAEGIRSLHLLHSFNHHTITSHLLIFLQEHEAILMGICDGSINNDPDMYKHLLNSLELIHSLAASDNCCTASIDIEIHSLRYIRFRALIAEIITLLDHDHTQQAALLGARKKLHPAIVLAKKNNDHAHITTLLSIERHIANEKYRNIGMSADMHSTIAKQLLSMLGTATHNCIGMSSCAEHPHSHNRHHN